MRSSSRRFGPNTQENVDTDSDIWLFCMLNIITNKQQINDK